MRHRVGPLQHRLASGSIATIGLLVILAATAIGVAVFFAIRRQTVIAETYTQFVRRKSGDRPAAPTPPPLPTQKQRPPTRMLLEGINPEKGQTVQISLAIETSRPGKYLVGRKQGVVHFHIPNTSISGQHATLIVSPDGRVLVEDRNSSNGTRINGSPLRPFSPQPLNPSDDIEFGEVKLRTRAG